MVYQHPWYVFSALHISNGRLGGLFISPMEKVAIGDETQLSATDQTRPVVPTVRARALIGLWAESGLTRSDASGRSSAALEPLWTRSDDVLCASGRPVPLRSVTLNIAVTKNSVISASGHYFAQRLVTATDACCCRATDRTHLVPIRAMSGHLCRARFFVILCPAWFPSSCLNFT